MIRSTKASFAFVKAWAIASKKRTAAGSYPQ
jgi:hypothetical protein